MPRNNVGARVQHTLCKLGGVDAGLLEVLEHGPGAPAAHEASLEWVDSSPDEGDAAAIAQSSHGYIFGSEAKLGADGGTCTAKSGGEVLGSDGEEFAIGVVRIEGGCGGSLVLT